MSSIKSMLVFLCLAGFGLLSFSSSATAPNSNAIAKAQPVKISEMLLIAKQPVFNPKVMRIIYFA